MKVVKIMINVALVFLLIVTALWPVSKGFAPSIDGVIYVGEHFLDEAKLKLTGMEINDEGQNSVERNKVFRERLTVYFNKPSDDYSPVVHASSVIAITGVLIFANIWMSNNLSVTADDIYAVYDDDDEDYV